jgi:predicted DNA-binding transcriptional regulator AlpA
MKTEKELKNTKWLSQRLNISVRTIQRLREINSPDLPSCYKFGNVCRYDKSIVEEWLNKRLTIQEKSNIIKFTTAG